MLKFIHILEILLWGLGIASVVNAIVDYTHFTEPSSGAAEARIALFYLTLHHIAVIKAILCIGFAATLRLLRFIYDHKINIPQ